MTIPKRSAISSNTKRNSLFQEAYRRLRNCSKDLPWSVKAGFLSEYSNMLRISGYTHKFRNEMVIGAIKRYEEMLEKELKGEIRFYRNRQQITNQKKSKGGQNPST